MRTNLNTQNHNPQFGMALKVNEQNKNQVENYLRKTITTPKDSIKLNQYIESQKNNPVDTFISTKGLTNSKEEKVVANVGGIEISGKNPLKVIKKAIAYANNYNNERIANEAKRSDAYKIISKLV